MKFALPSAVGALLLGTLLSLAPPPAAACSCLPPRDVLEAARESEAVFLGTVLRREPLDEKADSPFIARLKSFFGMRVRHGPQEQRFALSVDEPFKGIARSTIELATARDSAACGYAFEPGRRYLVFAGLNDDRLWVSLCSSTAPADSVPADDLAKLRTLAR